MKTSTQKVEFIPPANAIPEGSEVGEDFDVTCTFRVKDGGRVCLVLFGDVEMPGYNDKNSTKEERPGYAKYRKDMMAEPSGESSGESPEADQMMG